MKYLLGIVLSITVFLAGCAAGVQNLGTAVLLDGKTVEYIQIGSKGHDSARITVIEGYVYDEDRGLSAPISQYQAASAGLIEVIFSGSAAAALQAGGMIGAAALTRPNTTSVTQGGATSSASSDGADASASAEGGAGGKGVGVGVGVGKGGSSYSNSNSSSESSSRSRSNSESSSRVYNNNSNRQYQGQGQIQLQGQKQNQRIRQNNWDD